jgi:hypothetical protein
VREEAAVAQVRLAGHTRDVTQWNDTWRHVTVYTGYAAGCTAVRWPSAVRPIFILLHVLAVCTQFCLQPFFPSGQANYFCMRCHVLPEVAITTSFPLLLFFLFGPMQVSQPLGRTKVLQCWCLAKCCYSFSSDFPDHSCVHCNCDLLEFGQFINCLCVWERRETDCIRDCRMNSLVP